VPVFAIQKEGGWKKGENLGAAWKKRRTGEEADELKDAAVKAEGDTEKKRKNVFETQEGKKKGRQKERQKSGKHHEKEGTREQIISTCAKNLVQLVAVSRRHWTNRV